MATYVILSRVSLNIWQLKFGNLRDFIQGVSEHSATYVILSRVSLNICQLKFGNLRDFIQGVSEHFGNAGIIFYLGCFETLDVVTQKMGSGLQTLQILWGLGGQPGLCWGTRYKTVRNRGLKINSLRVWRDSVLRQDHNTTRSLYSLCTSLKSLFSPPTAWFNELWNRSRMWAETRIFMEIFRSERKLNYSISTSDMAWFSNIVLSFIHETMRFFFLPTSSLIHTFSLY